ncbi:MAG: acyl-CoA thioesterase [Micrococcaceae bacterium]
MVEHTGLTVSIPLRWGDMDAYGHINNARILSVLEEARIAVFGVPAGTGAPGGQPAPIDLLAGVPEGVLTLIAEHTVSYRRQLEYRTVAVQVRVRVLAVKGASVVIGYDLVDPVTEQVCVSATTTMVFVDGASGRPVRLSPQQRAALEPHLPG